MLCDMPFTESSIAAQRTKMSSTKQSDAKVHLKIEEEIAKLFEAKGHKHALKSIICQPTKKQENEQTQWIILRNVSTVSSQPQNNWGVRFVTWSMESDKVECESLIYSLYISWIQWVHLHNGGTHLHNERWVHHFTDWLWNSSHLCLENA